ncbi:sensor histidine kinase [Pararhizobium sp.]|uniref:sensor histidine kinase n=1 Tax=Pararhizobium sp. TaxID=1977563 RepID=UPI003FA722C1
MASRVDAIADSWLSRPVAGSRAGRDERVIVRAIAAASLLALPIVPLVLSAVLPVSLALPVGSALVASAALLAGVGCIALSRHRAERTASLPFIALPVRAGGLEPVSYDLFAGLVTIHDVRGDVLSVHGRDAAEMTRWMREPTGRGFIDQIHVSDRIQFLQAVDALRQGEESATIDIRMERRSALADGEQFLHMRCDMTVLCNGQGELQAILIQSRDVSEEARLRREAQDKTAIAEQANDAKTRFLAAVSHELRTPLNAILGFSDILSGEYFGKLENDRQREYVALINQSGVHLLSVVNTMLDMSKIEAGRYELIPEPFEVATAVKSCEAMLGHQAREKGVHLTSRIMRSVGEVNADQRALQQILINLVGNAIKFTGKGGVVTIDAENEGDHLKLVISDTGIGIAADKLGRLGQPFVQIQNQYSRQYEGTGLGLSLVKGLVALHGGTFDIASEPGVGTVISVRIPLDGSGIAGVEIYADPADGAVEFPPRLTSAAPTNRKRRHDDPQAKIA